MVTRWSLAVVALVLAGLAACGDDGDNEQPTTTCEPGQCVGSGGGGGSSGVYGP